MHTIIIIYTTLLLLLTTFTSTTASFLTTISRTCRHHYHPCKKRIQHQNQNSQFWKKQHTIETCNIHHTCTTVTALHQSIQRAYDFWNNEHSQEYDLWEHFAPHNKKGRDNLPLRYIEEYGRIWHERLRQLTEYKLEHGNCNVPVQYEANPQLGRWVNKQRIEYLMRCRGDVDYCITQERVDALNDIDFCWGLVSSPKEEWWIKYRQLKQYKLEHGHCNVPHVYPENESLGHWVSYQRWDYNQRQRDNIAKTNMSDQRIQALNAIQFTWNVNEESWVQRYRQLVEYFEEHDDCNVPLNYSHVPQLGAWVRTQRTEYRLKKLSKLRIKMLNEIQFAWNYGKDAAEEQWQRRYQQLVEYKDQYGDCNVPQGFADNPQLAIWVVTQRMNYKQNKNKWTDCYPDRIEALERIGFQWQLQARTTTKRVSWEERYQQLQAYRDQFGDCNVPYNYHGNKDNAANGLGVWVSVQRQHYKLCQNDGDNNYAGDDLSPSKPKKSIMTKDRIAALEAIDFSWESPRTKSRISWEQRYQDLSKFCGMHGHCNVPRNYEKDPSLGRWVHLQREQYRKLERGEKSTLTGKRIKAMEDIGFHWRVIVSKNRAEAKSNSLVV